MCVCLSGKMAEGWHGHPRRLHGKIRKKPRHITIHRPANFAFSRKKCPDMCCRLPSCRLCIPEHGMLPVHGHMLPRGHFHGLSDSVRRRSGRVLTRLGGTFPRSHTRKIPRPPATWPAEGGIFMKCICLASEGIVPNRHRQLHDYSATQMVQRFLR